MLKVHKSEENPVFTHPNRNPGRRGSEDSDVKRGECGSVWVGEVCVCVFVYKRFGRGRKGERGSF